jgi:hypothetical protein
MPTHTGPPSELAKPRGRARRRWERYGAGAQLSERAQAAGVNDVIRKPLVRRDIAEPLARALHKSAGKQSRVEAHPSRDASPLRGE